MLTLKQADVSDAKIIEAILNDGKALQRKQGFVQWLDDFPKMEMIEQDIASGNAFLFVDKDGNKAGYAFLPQEEPVYEYIEGQWLQDESFVVIHRLSLAESFQNQHLSSDMFEQMEQFARSQNVKGLRIDTHYENKRMQHLLQKYGFACCGQVQYDVGPRLAFEKLL